MRKFLEKYREAKSKLNETKENIIAGIAYNERNIEDTDEKTSDLKKANKNDSHKYLGLIPTVMAIATVAIGIVGITGGLAAPFVFAALALDIVAAAFEIRRVAKERRKEQAKGMNDEDTVATEISDTHSISSELSIENAMQQEYQPLAPDELKGLGEQPTPNKRERSFLGKQRKKPRQNSKNISQNNGMPTLSIASSKTN